MERHIVFDFIGIFTILNIHMTGCHGVCENRGMNCEQAGNLITGLCQIERFRNQCLKYCGLCTDTGPRRRIPTFMICPCSCEYKQRLDFWSNMTQSNRDKILEKILKRVEHIKNDLKVNKTYLSSYWSMRHSLKDHRKSSEYIGLAGVVVLVLIIASVILLDFLPRYTNKVGING